MSFSEFLYQIHTTLFNIYNAFACPQKGCENIIRDLLSSVKLPLTDGAIRAKFGQLRDIRKDHMELNTKLGFHNLVECSVLEHDELN